MKRKYFLLIIVCLVHWCKLAAITSPQPPEVPTISLLTCTPGPEVYALYGHTALRVTFPQGGQDLVFNYGMFDQRKPHFMWHFILGQTDYKLGVTDYATFAFEYQYRGLGVISQTLQLTPAQALDLYRYLVTQSQPAHSTYRYNYFYKNCTTMARDVIEQSLGQGLYYPTKGTRYAAYTAAAPLSFRSIVHQYTQAHPWITFGQDLLLGASADAPITAHQSMFAPFYFSDFMTHAMVGDSAAGPSQLLAQPAQQLWPSQYTPPAVTAFTPTFAACFLLLLCLILWGIERRVQRVLWGIDLILLTAQGLLGVLITFMFCCSIHPTVGTNLLVVLFTPLPLLLLPHTLCRTRRGHRSVYHLIFMIQCVAFVILWFVVYQYISTATWLIALTLLLLSVIRYCFPLSQRSLTTSYTPIPHV